MATQKQFQEVEQRLGFRYPLSFALMFEEFSVLLGTDGFRRVFPSAQLLLSSREIEAARTIIPSTLLPFMREEQRTWPDIYAFDFDSGGPEFRVVVWADHAIVMDWDNFPVFIQWIREHISKHDTAA